jgi:hypothetical protein
MNDTLYVFAPGYCDDYTNNDALFLRTINGSTTVSNANTATGLFGTQSAATSAAASVTANYHDVYFDYSTNFRPYVETPWFSSQYLTDGTDQPFTLATPFASGNSVSLAANVWSLTTDPNGASPDHALQVLVNGQPAGQMAWTGGGKLMQLSFTIPAGVLNPSSTNTIELVTPTLPNVTGQIALLHSLQISYTKTLDGSQPLTITNTVPNQIYEVGNLTTGGAWVIDARFPNTPALTSVEYQTQPDGSQTLRFSTRIGGTGQYLIVSYGMENAPLSVSPRKVTPLNANVKYLAVGPAQFASGTQPLIALHAKEGLRGMYVDQEQLFDYYGFGRYGPTPIQTAIRAVQPQYVLLVGRTTYDYLNFSGANVDPLCPAFLVSTTFWAQTTSDALFGDLGSGIPSIAIGRLPVNNTADLQGAVSHIVNYKGFPASGITAQLAADVADPAAGNFPVQADGIVASNPEFTWQRNYLGVTTQAYSDATAAITAAANGGANLLLYVGHGNAVGLGGEVGPDAQKILDTTSVQTWTGNVVLVQTTCNANWMAKDVQPYYSIAIQALTQPQGGISAGIGTSTYMNSDVAAAFTNTLLQNATVPGTRWGTALLHSQQQALGPGATSFNADLGRTEQLFGDPAMPVFGVGGGTSSGGTDSASRPIPTKSALTPAPSAPAAPSTNTPAVHGTF